MKHAEKLSVIFSRQMDALNKHRGKGQQKVTVEYVNVESGGQAVVGSVETAAAPPKLSDQSQAAPKALAPASEKVFEMIGRTGTPANRLGK